MIWSNPHVQNRFCSYYLFAERKLGTFLLSEFSRVTQLIIAGPKLVHRWSGFRAPAVSYDVLVVREEKFPVVDDSKA